MRETVRSLSIYFFVVGLFSTVASLPGLLRVDRPLFLVASVLTLGFGLAYLYCGVRLRQLLVGSPDVILKLLAIVGVSVLVSLALNLLAGRVSGGVAGAAIGLLITWYLYVNVRRLAGEVRNGDRTTG